MYRWRETELWQFLSAQEKSKRGRGRGTEEESGPVWNPLCSVIVSFDDPHPLPRMQYQLQGTTSQHAEYRTRSRGHIRKPRKMFEALSLSIRIPEKWDSSWDSGDKESSWQEPLNSTQWPGGSSFKHSVVISSRVKCKNLNVSWVAHACDPSTKTEVKSGGTEGQGHPGYIVSRRPAWATQDTLQIQQSNNNKSKWIRAW